jgi:TonB family protein
MSSLTHQLIHLAARQAPSDLSERLEEEWLADLTERRGHLSRVLFGLGCCWATTVIAYEHRSLNISTASTASGRGTMTAYVTDALPFSRRTLAFAGIVGFHVLVIYAFASGLAARIIPTTPTTQAEVIQEAHVRETPPPLNPGVKFEPTKIIIPPQPPQIFPQNDRPTAPTDVGTQTIQPPTTGIAGPAPAIAATVERVGGGPGKGFPSSDDFYPPGAIRMGQTGTSTIQVCVDPTGHLSSTPTIGASSGSALLDQGALRLAKAGSGHYRPSTENGTAINSCFGLRITFNLKN